jgi:hypothetical protein
MKKFSPASSKTKESSKLRGFLRGSFLSSTSSNKSAASSSSHRRKEGNNKTTSKKSSDERQGRDRTLRTTLDTDKNANGRRSLSGAKSADILASKQKPSHAHHHGSHSDLRLRSKSPSRQRIEQFMKGMRARERSRSVSRDRQLRTSGSDLQTSDSEHRSARQRLTSSDHQRVSSHERDVRRSSNEILFRTRSTSTEKLVRSTSTEKLGQSTSKERVVRSTSSHQRSSSQERLQQLLESRSNKKSPRQSVEDDDSSSEEDSDDGRSFFSTGAKSTEHSKSSHRTASVTPESPSLRRSLFAKLPSRKESDSDDPEAWFRAINQRDWVSVEELIRSYDFKKYRPDDSNSAHSRKQQKKLRVLKYLPSKSSKSFSDEDDAEEEELISPLLRTDSHGRTALHLACKEFMPWRMLQSLFFLERGAVTIVDNDGRLSLHHALISNHDTRILDRFIHANAEDLLLPDSLSRTPMGYAILRAAFKRDSSIEATWRTPLTKEELDWQTQQTEKWTNAQFLLDALVARRKLLSKKYERRLLLEAAEAFAPPSVIDAMLSVSARILQPDQGMAEQLLQLLINQGYSISIIQKALKICSETMPQMALVSCIRRGMAGHYEGGCVVCYREEFQRETSFRTEIIQAYKQMHMASGDLALTVACQEWWDTLKFLIGYSSLASLKPQALDESYLLHYILMIPDSSPSLVELLIRMFPNTRFVADPQTEALPIHLACQFWKGSASRNGNDTEALQVLNLVVAGDFELARQRYHRRYPLQLAILARQSWLFVKTIVTLRPKVVNVIDPWTRLYPFQLAAMDKAHVTSDPKDDALSLHHNACYDNEDGQLDVVFELLKMNPVAVSPILSCGSGDPKGDLGPVAQHVLSWCYVFKRHGWVLNRQRLETLRNAISNGRLPESMLKWFEKLKLFIWKVYDWKNAGKYIAYMPHHDIFLVHAALSNGGTPPIAIELLLELFPNSIKTPIPGTNQLPAHVAAESPSYPPMPFETVISMTSALEMLVLAHPGAATLESDGRNLLQIAIDSGKTWPEVQCIVLEQPTLLKLRDARNHLFPFQQMASAESFMPLQDWMQAKTFALKWTDRSPAENGLMLRRFQREYHLEKLSAIVEMLRAQPEALEVCMP